MRSASPIKYHRLNHRAPLCNAHPMGKNSQRRRAQKPQPQATTRNSDAEVAQRSCSRSSTTLLELGWQPADLVHTVKRMWTLRASRMVVAFIANHSRRNDAATRAPQTWLAQLEDMGVYDPHARRHSRWYRRCARRVGREPNDFIRKRHSPQPYQILGQLAIAPHLSVLITPPSCMGSNQHRTCRAHGRVAIVDEKALRLIRAMLAKAEATSFEAEAETFTAKAQELMTRHSIDAAMMASAAEGLDAHRRNRVAARAHRQSRMATRSPHSSPLLHQSTTSARCGAQHCGFSTLVGFPVDLASPTCCSLRCSCKPLMLRHRPPAATPTCAPHHFGVHS